MKDGGDQLFERAFQAWIGQRLHGLRGVENVQGGVWVVLKLEWSPRTPPVESCRGRSSFHQPPLLLLSLRGSPISILPFFLVSAAASFSPISVFPCFLASSFNPISFFPFFFLASSFSPISVFPFFFAMASFLVLAADALLVFLLYFRCYEY